MANYTKSTNFASKDSLLTGNPSKLVRGSEIDTEYNNISTAIATKADLASPTLTGTPTAPTAAAGTNTTQLATTQFVTTNFPSTNITFSGDNSYTGMQTFRDNKFEVVDNSDTTKKVALEVSGVTTATTRTLTVPDKNGTIAVTSDLVAATALNTVNSTIVAGTYSVSGSTTATITATHAFSVGQEVFITFTNTSGSAISAGKFTIVTVTGTTSFTVTLGSSTTSAGNVTVERYGLMAVANAAEMTVGTSQLKAVTPKQLRDNALVFGTNTATTSGTTVTFSSVPAWARRITVLFNNVSASGTNNILVKLGTSGGIVSTGYLSGSAQVGNGVSTIAVTDTTGFIVSMENSSRPFIGTMTICLISGTTWVASHSGTLSSNARGVTGGGNVDISGALTQVQIALDGANTFDAGSVNIIYE